MVEECTFKDPSGLQLAGLIDKPELDEPQEAYILLHGFTGWKEENHLVTLAQLLAGNGYLTLRYDAPGSGESEGTFAEHYRLSAYIDTVQPALEFLHRQFGLAKEHIGLWGHSMGGFVALEAGRRNQSQLSCICASQPSKGPSAVSQVEAETWRNEGWMTFSNERFSAINLPYDFCLDRLGYDATKAVPEIRLPTFYIAGSLDTEIPAETVKQIYAAANQPKEYLEFPTGHCYKDDPDQLAAINQATLAFFQRNINTTFARRRFPG
jgi:pimeloyl-ACP methyl ester carboxylesterase